MSQPEVKIDEAAAADPKTKKEMFEKIKETEQEAENRMKAEVEASKKKNATKLTPREKQLRMEEEFKAEKERKKQIRLQEEALKKQQQVEAIKRAQEESKKKHQEVAKTVIGGSSIEMLEKSREEQAKKDEFKKKFGHFNEGPQAVNQPQKVHPDAANVSDLKSKFQE